MLGLRLKLGLVLKVLTHGAASLEILHAIVAVVLSSLEIVSCNVTEVESKSTFAILHATLSKS